ncbi:MAG TPA: universal stress protein [Burkholderiales bacterium]|jgi:nucleotide-binding universal stress UspA family protein|nr:universal stress protein [Burkholderiales bacterium]HSA70473.1 universal stress protein [Burkholderiales bacterium]
MGAYRKILVAVDGSTASAKGLREALRLAKAEGARLFILHVVDEYPAFAALDGMMAGAPGADLVPALREGGKRVLARAKTTAEKAGVPAKAVLREMLSGPAAYPIVREARKLGADLIVLGTHGRRGVRRLVLGSDAEQVVRTASVPVLLVRG